MSHTNEDLALIWEKTLSSLKTQVSEQTYNAWFHPITPISFEKNVLALGVPNEFFKDWIAERYLHLMKSTCSGVTGNALDICLSIVSPKDQKNDETTDASQGKEKKGLLRSFFSPASNISFNNTSINPKYTFDDFVIGSSNRFSHAACLAVSESLAKTYNPLFIYGGVGLGKTHLMHAIGNYCLKKSQKVKILYISSEEFTNQLISAIQTRGMIKFRQKYRNTDVILIDDIQFIAGKESTQEEFFHTFNALYDAHKQIVISSDRSPKEIPKLEERLISRFAWGLVADIQPPDFETRMAILKKKCEKETIHVPDDVFYFLAENIKSNIRELEGGLIRVVAYARLLGKNVSVDVAKEVLKGMIKESAKNINIDLIQKKVAEYFNLSMHDMKSKTRTQNIAYPRQIAMYLSRDLTSLSLPEIGGYFGGKDHTTVIHACNKIAGYIKSKEGVSDLIKNLMVNIKE